MYPVMLNIAGKSCLVVGGGGVALRKIHGLLAEGAKVHVVAREPVGAITELASSGEIELAHRSYRAGEAAQYRLVMAATDDRGVNRRVYEDAVAADIWVNVADDPELCTFHLPARVKRGELQLAIASAGNAPFAVRRLRQLLERKIGPEWAEWIGAAARFRNRVRAVGLDPKSAEACYDSFFTATVNSSELSSRVPVAEEEQQLLNPGDSNLPPSAMGKTVAQASNRSEAIGLDRALTSGFVSLVGAGPGDPGLMTLKGRQRLMTADAVVYDNLAAPALPTDLPDVVELHCVGKRAGNHPVPQSEIQALLVRLAKQGKRVVRLKGGDPYVFGRGGEEAEELVRHGISFEVVPCVTAAVAVPAYAGIPVTYRGEVVRVTMVTAHESIKKQGPQVRWDLLAQDPHGVLIGYMGVTSLPQISARLTEAGMSPQTPAAMIERGTTSAQRTVKSTVAALPKAAEEAGIRPPALFVIGSPIARARNLDWFQNRPLFGQRVALFGASSKLSEQLERGGAQIVILPNPVSDSARVVMTALPLTACILRDRDDVDAIAEERHGASWHANIRIICISGSAYERTEELGWPNVQLVDSAGVNACLRQLMNLM